MCSYVLFATLVVLTYMCHLNEGEQLTKDTVVLSSVQTKRTKFHRLEFWNREKLRNENKRRHFKLSTRRRKPYRNTLDDARKNMERLLHDRNEEKDVLRYTDIERIQAKLSSKSIAGAKPAKRNVGVSYRRSHGKPGHVHGPHHKHKEEESQPTNTTQILAPPSTSRDDNISVFPDSVAQKDMFPKLDQALSYRTASLPDTTKLINRKTNLNLNHAQRMHLAEDTTTEPTTEETKGETTADATAEPRASSSKDGSMETNLDHSELSPYSLYKVLDEIFIPQFEKEGVNMTIEVLGRTVEFNDIILVRASYKPPSKDNRYRAEEDENKYDESAPDKKILFIVHGLAVMGFNLVPCLRSIGGLKKLMSFYFKHLKEFDIFIIPIANPDGVNVAAQRSYWNKNISPQSACPGVALDRNFEVAWDEDLAKSSSCSQQYPGPSPFSEAESQAVRNVFHRYSHRIAAYFHVHAGTYNTNYFKGDAVLHPKGFQEQNSDDDKYIDMRGEIEEVMKNASFKVYSVSVDTLYSWYGGRVTGTSVDYASSVYGVPFALELVMQLYDDDMMVDSTAERETSAVLNEVWSRLIEVICNFIHKTVTKPTNEK